MGVFFFFSSIPFLLSSFLCPSESLGTPLDGLYNSAPLTGTGRQLFDILDGKKVARLAPLKGHLSTGLRVSKAYNSA